MYVVYLQFCFLFSVFINGLLVAVEQAGLGKCWGVKLESCCLQQIL